MGNKKAAAALFTVVFLLCFQGQAFAHRMLVEMIDHGLLLVKYDDGTSAGLAEISLYDEDSKRLLEGQTDTEGYFRFDPAMPVHSAVAEDGMGHRARWVVGQEENWWLSTPAWARGLLGVSIFVFFAAYTNNRRSKKTG